MISKEYCNFNIFFFEIAIWKIVFLEVLSFYLLSSDFRSRYDQMNDGERKQNAILIFQKLELIGFSDSVRSQVKNDLQTISPDLFKLPVRQVSLKYSRNIEKKSKENLEIYNHNINRNFYLGKVSKNI